MQLERPLSERKKSNSQLIVGRLVDCSNQSKGFWPREMRLCKKLVTTYGEEFLLWLTPPNFKAKSLAVYLGAWGKEFLSKQLFEFKRNVAPLINTVKTDGEAIASADKIGEDVEIKTKPKSLQDFLKMYQK